MITSYGAPIGPADAKIIVDYLAANYGSGRATHGPHPLSISARWCSMPNSPTPRH